MDLFWHSNNKMWLHLKLKQKKNLPQVTDCVYACVCDAFNQPSGTERAFLLFFKTNYRHRQWWFWFWHVGFHAALSPHAVTARRLVCDRAGEITTQHMELYDRTISIQNTFTLMESMPHQVGCGRQHLKAINGQASTESLMTTCWK